MRNIKIYVLFLCCILILIPEKVLASKMMPFMTLGSNYPNNVYRSGFITSAATVRLVITWSVGGTINVGLIKIVDGARSTFDFIGSQVTQTSSSYVGEKVAGFTGYLAIAIIFTPDPKIYPYKL